MKRELVDEAGGRCAVCGYDRCIINLHFHHVEPSKKSFAMTVAMGKVDCSRLRLGSDQTGLNLAVAVGTDEDTFLRFHTVQDRRLNTA